MHPTHVACCAVCCLMPCGHVFAAPLSQFYHLFETRRPGVYAAAMYADEAEPSKVLHDLRVYANEDEYLESIWGVKRSLLEEYNSGFDAAYPFTGVIFADDARVIQNPKLLETHELHTPYSYPEGLIGPAPNMRNGDRAPPLLKEEV